LFWTDIQGIVSALLVGVIVGVLVKYLLDWYYRPRLLIDGDDAIIIKQIYLNGSDNKPILVTANRIRVSNEGRSAARDCKAYADYGEYNGEYNIQRISWMMANRNSGYTVILNVKDKEFIDLCGLPEDGKGVIVPPEHGYSTDINSCSRLAGDTNITIRITASNAKPTERRVKIYDKAIPSDPPRHRIVELQPQLQKGGVHLLRKIITNAYNNR
jgi:hypothetical protein